MSESKTSVPPRQVVAIGASAGGLPALQAMLPTLPLGQGTSYVLVQHMDPTHPSVLDRILQRGISLVVKLAGDQDRLETDCVHIIPPDQDGTVADGVIHLAPTDSAHGPRHTVDILFQSVAEAYGAQSVGIVLSGTGCDGLQGVRAIKAAEGVALVQDPETTDYNGMPRAVIHERLADVIARPEKMGEELANVLNWPEKLPPSTATEADTLQALVRVLMRKTGVSFDQYKETTLQRRIERRRIVTRQPNLANYLSLIETSETEADLLMQDTLISVTQFFRDAETFAAIEHALKALVAAKHSGDAIRIWVPGCATGEEAFSIAMLLAEALGDGRRTREVQIFATDIDERAISTARKSVYLKSATGDFPPALIEKYLVSTDGTVCIAPSIRDMVTFAKHDLMQDPPFIRVDMVSCRNVLIYFKRLTQVRLMESFHYILNPEGYLVLGPSESVGKLTELFEPITPHANVFIRRDVESMPPALLHTKRILPPVSGRANVAGASTSIEQRIQERIFEQYAPSGVVVDQRFDVLHSKGDVSPYITLPEGDISVNVLAMAAVALRVELRLMLQKVEREQRVVRSNPIAFDTNGTRVTLTLIGIPMDVPSGHGKQTLVLFEPRPLVATVEEGVTTNENTAFRVRELEQELEATRDHLQTNIEELEASNEELQSVNEEYQSTTEELQSANEELQTTNEELQSTNEELSTVNEELRIRSADLDNANRDLENVLNTAVSGVVVLDHELRVTRYSAASREIFNLLPTSIGKPLISVGGAVDLAVLSNEIQQALASNAPVERELELGDKVFLVRLIPPDKEASETGGLLISFIEVTEALVDARDARRLATVLRNSSDAITVQDRAGQILAWNRGAESMYGYSEAEALAMNIDVIVPAAEQKKRARLIGRIYAGAPVGIVETTRRCKDGSEIEVSIAVAALLDEKGQPYGLTTTERDLTPIVEVRNREAAFAQEARLTTAGQLAAGLAHELNQPVTSVMHFCDVALSISEQFDRKRRDELIEALTHATAQAKRAGDIIHTLRRFLGRRKSVRSPQAINQIIEETHRLLRPMCDAQKVELCLSLDDGLPDVTVDNSQIAQVLANLVSNSVDAMVEANSDPRRITISSQIDGDPEHSIQMTIEDTGPGLDHDSTERLFQPFHTEKPNGLGLGLWISRSIVESHGGRLWADEAASAGAAFHFSLPSSNSQL